MDFNLGSPLPPDTRIQGDRPVPPAHQLPQPVDLPLNRVMYSALVFVDGCKAPGVKVEVGCLNLLIGALCGFKPSLSTYETKISALCGAGRTEDAAAVLEMEMAERGCAPAASTYHLVMRGLCEERRSQRAAEYLPKMDLRGGCAPSKETYETVMEGLCGEGRFVEASTLPCVHPSPLPLHLQLPVEGTTKKTTTRSDTTTTPTTQTSTSGGKDQDDADDDDGGGGEDHEL